MNQEIFHSWFKDHFLLYIPTQRPVILLMDGHKSHYNPETIQLAAEEGVVLFALPPNTTHISQPLDKSCFGPLKSAWREACHKFTTSNPGKVVSRFSFSQIFHEAWDSAMTRNNIIAGFRVTGIYPLCRAALIPQPHDEEKSRLPYIPLLTPGKRRSLSERRVTFDLPDSDESREDEDTSYLENEGTSYLEDEDTSYVEESPLYLKKRCITSILKYPPDLPEKAPRYEKASHVLTSVENIRLIRQREEEREEAARIKAENKAIREQRKKEKEEEKQRKMKEKEEERQRKMKEKEQEKQKKMKEKKRAACHRGDEGTSSMRLFVLVSSTCRN